MNIYFKKGRLLMAGSLHVLFVFLIVSSVAAQHLPGEDLKPLTPSEYGKWESVRGADFSKDGNWVSVITGTNEGDRNLKLKNLRSGEEVLFENVNGIEYSPDNQWVILRRTLPGKDMQRIREVGGELESRAWLYSLREKDTVTVNNLKKYEFSNDGAFLAMTKTRDHGNSLLIRNMKSGREISFGNVQRFEWNSEKNILLFLIENQKGDSEIQLYDPVTGSIQLLDNHDGEYVSMQWLENSSDVMIIKETEDDTFKEVSHKVVIYKDLDKGVDKKIVFDPHQQGLIDADQRVMADGIKLSADGDRLFFNLYYRTKKYTESPKEVLDTLVADTEGHGDVVKPVFHNKHDEAPDLQIWHSKDKVLVPAQRVSGMKGFKKPRTAVYNFGKQEITLLQDEVLEKVNVEEDQRFMLGYDETPYEREGMFGRHYYDVYLVDAGNGKNKKLVEKVSKYYELSPDENFFIYLKNNRFFIYDIAEEISQDLTGHLEVSFIDEHNDHPLPQKPAYGFVGWAEDGRSFLLNSEFDVWQFFVDGRAPRNLTNGKKDQNIFRLDFTAKDGGLIDTRNKLFYAVEGKWTKRTGYAAGKPGSAVKNLIFEDAGIRRIARNDQTGQIVYIRSSYDIPGDAFYTADRFITNEQLTSINEFQGDYQWSKAELVDYTTSQGHRAQGVLYYPANYSKGEKYPMITYVYEKLSHGLHNYMQPSENDYYNTLLWVQSGYFVFKPDMEFEAGNPGVSAARTLENAVGAVVQKGDVDAEKVGLIGHSWGGYQAGFVPTQTDIFAASVAGAGLTNLISMNLAVTPAFGWRPENDHFEVGQERMEVAPWMAPEKYVANSTVMQIDNLNTPVMFMVGDADANVNWSQGVEYYNAARRAGKEFVLLVYENEGHSLSRKNNQIDYQQRILKWFGYHLKGEQPEDWMTGSVPYSEQQERLRNWND
ncbi:S9 family peptidase [Robertkochia marina]|uniref:S9 family peptidase n=1 Tax=Robertkochia marina TaxID=1227945 RepID=A0A4S3LZI4_9FLAO|nr:prolyl oligopeptidase family serine peptidase [Robertkochia marina]THD67540.1 S9 family peptidase [Robertkochia marina]TRZ44592.1 S9 family peptidase [Robertkochia marina]